MNWLLLTCSSVIGAIVILYALWPRMVQNTKIRAIAFSLALAAIIVPAGINYYFYSDGDIENTVAATMPFEYPDLGDTSWKGPINTSTPQSHDTMSMSSVTARLEAKLKQNPNDIGGWILLGRSYVALGQPSRAVSIFEEKVEEFPNNSDLLLSYGETLTEINGGNVTAKSAEMFQKALNQEPANPRAGYDLALYEIQQGQSEEALKRLNLLLKAAPGGAPWTTQVKEKIRSLQGKQVGENTMKQPTKEQVAEVSAMAPQDRSDFIRSMVDGLPEELAENPDNLNGWLNLGRSYGVLNEWPKSVDAYQKALELSPDDQNIKLLLEQATAKANTQ